MKEIISICVGDAGLRVGNEYWRLIANEHWLDFVTGQMKQQIEGNEGIHKVFQENRLNGEFIPRSIFIDANEMCYEKVFEEQNLAKNWMKVLGKYESSVNFAEGKYNLYKNIKNDVDDAIAKELEKWDSLDTILIFASTCGGTGSAFISKFATIFQNYINFIQVPSTLKMNNPIEIYNAQLSLSSFYSNHSFSVLADNYSAYNIYNKKKKFFGISAPSKEKALDKINKVLAHVYSNITAPSRFGNSYSLKNLIVDSKDYPVECMSIPSIECKDYSPTNSYDSVENLTKETLSLNNSLLQSNTSLYRIVSTFLHKIRYKGLI